jgi:hypothetical protein
MFQDFFLRLKLDKDFRSKVFTFIGVVVALIAVFIVLIFITISNAQNQTTQTEPNPQENTEAREEFVNSFSNNKNFQKLSEKPLYLPTVGNLNDDLDFVFYSYQNNEEGFPEGYLTFSTEETVKLNQSFLPTNSFQDNESEVILNGINQVLLIKNKKNVLNYPKNVLSIAPNKTSRDYLFLKNEDGVLNLKTFSSILGNTNFKKTVYSEFFDENANYRVHPTSTSSAIIKSETINKSGDIEVTSLSSLLKARKTRLQDVSFYFVKDDYLFYQNNSDKQDRDINVLNLVNMEKSKVNLSPVFQENNLKGNLELFRCGANSKKIYCLAEKEAVTYIDYSEDVIISFDLSTENSSLIYQDKKINGYTIFTNEQDELVVVSQPAREAYLILD